MGKTHNAAIGRPQSKTSKTIGKWRICLLRSGGSRACHHKTCQNICLL